jgi:hypothetical protein
VCMCVCVCVYVCAFVVVAVVVWASSGLFSGTQLQTLFSPFFFPPSFKKRKGGVLSQEEKSQQVCLSLQLLCCFP